MTIKKKCEICKSNGRAKSLRKSPISGKRLCFKCYEKESSEIRKGNYKYNIVEDEKIHLRSANNRNKRYSTLWFEDYIKLVEEYIH